MRQIDADWLLDRYGLRDAVKYGNRDAGQRGNSYDTLMKYEIADLINDAPTIAPDDNWIPCAERLPTFENDDRTKPCIVTAKIGFPPIRYSFPANRRKTDKREYWEGANGREMKNIEVLAWQPLSKPYNPDHKED